MLGDKIIEQKNKIKRLKSYARKIKAKIQSPISLYLNSSYHLNCSSLSVAVKNRIFLTMILSNWLCICSRGTAK